MRQVSWKCKYHTRKTWIGAK